MSQPSGAITISSNVETIGERAFSKRTGITSVTIEGDPYFMNYVFDSCTNMITVNMPNVTKFKKTRYDMAGYVFNGCNKLPYVALPSFNSAMPGYIFQNCSLLATADLGGVTKISDSVFKGCSALRTLVLRKADGACELGAYSANALGGIYSNPSHSTIYVPEALISSYQTATNWSSLYLAGVTFAKIEGSIYE